MCLTFLLLFTILTADNKVYTQSNSATPDQNSDVQYLDDLGDINSATTFAYVENYFAEDIKMCPEILINEILLFPESLSNTLVTLNNTLCRESGIDRSTYELAAMNCLENGIWERNSLTTCSNWMKINNITLVLFYLSRIEHIDNDTLRELDIVINDNIKNLSDIDFDIISEIIWSSVWKFEQSPHMLFQIVDNLPNIDRGILVSAQRKFNTAIKILVSLSYYGIPKNFNFVGKNLLRHYISEDMAHSGIIVLKEQEHFIIEIWDEDIWLRKIQKIDFEYAFRLNFNASEVIGGYGVNVFTNNYFFIQENTSDAFTIGSHILDFIHYSEGPNPKIFIYFKAETRSDNKKCMQVENLYYYNFDQYFNQKWNIRNDAIELRNEYYFCEFNWTNRHRTLTALNRAIPSKNFQITQELQNLLTEDSNTALQGANDIINYNKENFTSKNIDIITKIVIKACEDFSNTTNSSTFFELIDNILNIDKDKLASGQEEHNSTDQILYNLDKFLLKQTDIEFISENLIITTIPEQEEICGAMVRKENDTFITEFLFINNWYTTIQETDFEIAFRVNFNESENKENCFMSFFRNDNFFNQKDISEVVENGALGILFPDGIPQPEIIIYFKITTHSDQEKCEHWQYGLDSKGEPIIGQWAFDTNATKLRDGYYICEYNHTTHFAMLTFPSKAYFDNKMLNILTIVGTSLSFIGITLVAITALIFKKWRQNNNTKIVLSVSFCWLLLIVLFFLTDKIEPGAWCITAGILLHYIVLAQFCWTLVISYSSYRRLYLKLHFTIENTVTKFSLFSWIAPIVPVCVTAVLDHGTYNKSSDLDICYPKEMYLTFGVCLPIYMILAFNLIIYILILSELKLSKLPLKKHGTMKSVSVNKSLLALFFMMGLNWIVGVFIVFIDDVACIFFYCLCTTINGAMIFWFYVVDSKEVRVNWKGKLVLNNSVD